MRITNVEVYGLDNAIRVSKYPMEVEVEKCTPEITKRTKSLASCDMGTGHDNFLNGVIVQFDLTFSIKAWTEAERYHFLDFISSQSTMHRISNMNIRECCNKYVTENTINEVLRLQEIYLADKTPENYLTLLYNVPVGFELTAGMTTNYRQLKTIYHQRKLHRLPEWREVCKWIETLPKFTELILSKES